MLPRFTSESEVTGQRDVQVAQRLQGWESELVSNSVGVGTTSCMLAGFQVKLVCRFI